MASDSPSRSRAHDNPLTKASENTFSVSAKPLVPERNGKRSAHALDDLPLPRSYGLETLWLLPRDPHSLFAYWDIDWKAAFGEENPRPREVQLRLREPNETTATSVKVEPMAGYCSVNVPKADTSYLGEIGFVDAGGVWHLVSQSAVVTVPPETEGRGETADFATIPMHLSFQQMLDSARSEPEETDSITELLSRLRKETAAQTASQQHLSAALAAAEASVPGRAPARDLWAQHRLEAILGFGNSSLSHGFGGSSRS